MPADLPAFLVERHLMAGQRRRPGRLQSGRAGAHYGYLFGLTSLLKFVQVLEAQGGVGQAADGFVFKEQVQAALLATDAGPDILVLAGGEFIGQFRIRQGGPAHNN
ncbi:MAG: hypothetical protein BWY80_00453 [Firmicutes bacterium ADurb.Bin456]|nr:MAG: hypothetical protein BWY80_00453 [Firmicutes bacterium ADurb.Bin456]